jgi:F-type H+-transporting ATPase subunit delta
MAATKKKSQTKHNSPASVAYARSLLELANEKGIAEAIGAELSQIAEIVGGNPSFEAFLSDPGISEEERRQVMDRVFMAQVSPLMKNFLGVLNTKNALRLTRQIGDAYEDLYGEQLGKVEVDVTVAQRLTNDELDEVRRRVSTALKKDAVVHQYVDENILGGLVLRVQDKLIDASVRYQLQAIKNQMLGSR